MPGQGWSLTVTSTDLWGSVLSDLVFTIAVNIGRYHLALELAAAIDRSSVATRTTAHLLGGRHRLLPQVGIQRSVFGPMDWSAQVAKRGRHVNHWVHNWGWSFKGAYTTRLSPWFLPLSFSKIT